MGKIPDHSFLFASGTSKDYRPEREDRIRDAEQDLAVHGAWHGALGGNRWGGKSGEAG